MSEIRSISSSYVLYGLLNSFSRCSFKGNARTPVKAVRAVHALMQPVVRPPCPERNDCEHLCIVTATTDNPLGPSDGQLGYRCACKTGYKLKRDRKSCERIHTFLMYSQQKFIKGKVMPGATSSEESFNDAIQPIVSRSARFVGLDFDAHQGKIEYSFFLISRVFHL